MAAELWAKTPLTRCTYIFRAIFIFQLVEYLFPSVLFIHIFEFLLRQGWDLLTQTCEFSGVQFTKHFHRIRLSGKEQSGS